MNEGAQDFYDDQEGREAINQFLKMSDNGKIGFFDVFQFEAILDHFLEEGDTDKSAIGF